VFQQNLAVCYEELGTVVAAERKLQEALDAYEQSLKIRQTLTGHNKSDLVMQRELSVGYKKVGDALTAQGDLADALTDYRFAFAISENLASQDSSNVDWQNNAAWSRYCIAKTLIRVKDGDRNEAKRLIFEGIDIITRLEHRGTLSSDAQDTLNKLNELAAAFTSLSSKH